MVPWRVEYSDCGERRTARDVDGEPVPYVETCRECGGVGFTVTALGPSSDPPGVEKDG